MQEAPTGTPWFAPPEIFTKQANTPWHDRKNPGDPKIDPAKGQKVVDRILAVLLSRTMFVVEKEICDPRDLNWMTRTALGFRKGLLDLAADMGMEKVHSICSAYAEKSPDFPMPEAIIPIGLSR